MLDPWRTLGLEPGAPAAEVKRAYRRLAKTFHPDSAGAAALPRFLAIQQAYEALLAPRSPRTGLGQARPTRPPTRPGWQADPTRAKATGGPRRGPRPAGAGAPGANPGQKPGTGADASAGAGERARPPRRPSKRATFGSTTYDDVHGPPSEDGWSGASWYGTTSGEYWTINPREYADPRKHGPEYQARAARPESARRQGATDDRPPSPQPPPTQPRPERPVDPPWASGAVDPAAAAAFPKLPTFRLPDGRTRSGRLTLALIAWPPIGLVASSFIGAATGCAHFTAACAPGADLLPWAAQVAILAILTAAALAWPRALRALAAGTIAVTLVAIPATILLAAARATYDPIRGPAALSILLVAGWLAGIGLEASGRLRSLGQAPTR